MEVNQLHGSTGAIIEPLYKDKGWIKLVGLVHFIAGIIACCTIVGAFTGWIPLWIGYLLIQVEKLIKSGYENGNEAELKTAMEQLALAAKIFGIVTLIGLIINVMMIILGILYFLLIFIGIGLAIGANS
jgi:hypothetical protein